MGQGLDEGVLDLVLVAVREVFFPDLRRNGAERTDAIGIDEILDAVDLGRDAPGGLDHGAALEVLIAEMGELLPPAVADDFVRPGFESGRLQQPLVVAALGDGQIDIEAGHGSGAVIAELLEKGQVEFLLLPAGHDLVAEHLDLINFAVLVIRAPEGSLRPGEAVREGAGCAQRGEAEAVGGIDEVDAIGAAVGDPEIAAVVGDAGRLGGGRGEGLDHHAVDGRDPEHRIALVVDHPEIPAVPGDIPRIGAVGFEDGFGTAVGRVDAIEIFLTGIGMPEVGAVPGEALGMVAGRLQAAEELAITGIDAVEPVGVGIGDPEGLAVVSEAGWTGPGARDGPEDLPHACSQGGGRQQHKQEY